MVRIMLQGRTVAAPAPRVNLDQTVSTTVIVTTVIFTTFLFFFTFTMITFITFVFFTFFAGALCNPVDGKCKCKPGFHQHGHDYLDLHLVHIIIIIIIIANQDMLAPVAKTSVPRVILVRIATRFTHHQNLNQIRIAAKCVCSEVKKKSIPLHPKNLGKFTL